MVNLSTLNPQQRLAVETVRGPVLILAGAGTGKTRVITYRIAHMVARGIKPGNILAVTFTNKAAREMKERVTKLLPRARQDEGEADKPTISTFHSLCMRILRQHIEVLGYKKSFVIYDEAEQLGAIKKILSHISAKGEKTDPKVIHSLISRYKNGGLNPKLVDESAIAMAQHIARRYDSALKACNAVDFDDLLLLVLKLFREHPAVLEACRAKYRYVMVDEYQDTNAAQFELVNMLCQEHRNLCVVGDDDQSIYGWRGAEIANLLDLEKHFPEVKVVKLEQNYRSTNIILNAANAVIKNNVQRRGKQLWSAKGDGNRITLNTFETDEDEARTVVEEIEFLRMAKRVPWKECAILFRTNIQSTPLEIALRKAGVRYNLIGGQSIFDRREIRDTLAYLKTMVNPHDDISLLRIANVPARGLSDVTMRHTDVQAMFTTKTREAIGEFVKFIEETRAPIESADMAVRPSSLTQWAEKFLADCGYIDDLRRGEKSSETADNRVRNIKDLLARLDQTGSGPCGERISDFLEELTLDADRQEEKQAEKDAVTLITMHSCKGLEFPNVFIVGLEDGLLPHSRSKVEGTLDEERRLFYVAITRAMLTLTMSHCQTRKKYGQALPCHPSGFLQEIPEDFIERGDEKAKAPVAAAQGKSMFAALRESLG
jgi:DNA helicase II / ATP-dependent DNA helicase PcrA